MAVTAPQQEQLFTGMNCCACIYASFMDENTSRQSPWMLSIPCRRQFRARLHCRVKLCLHLWATVMTTVAATACNVAGVACVMSTFMMRLMTTTWMIQVCVCVRVRVCVCVCLCVCLCAELLLVTRSCDFHVHCFLFVGRTSGRASCLQQF